MMKTWNIMNFSTVWKIIPVLVAAAALATASGCKSGKNEEAAGQSRPEPETAATPNPTPAAKKSQRDEGNLDWFLAELRDAVNSQDMYRLAALMTPNFGYQLNPPLEGDGVFQYWDENNLWGELALIVNDEFVPNGNFLVAPPEFADPATLYTGYRAGIVKVGGLWKFAYFVRD